MKMNSNENKLPNLLFTSLAIAITMGAKGSANASQIRADELGISSSAMDTVLENIGIVESHYFVEDNGPSFVLYVQDITGPR